MYYYLGWPFVTDDQEVVCAGATNPAYLTDWFTSRKLVTASATSATIFINFPAAVRIEYVVLYAITAPNESLSPTWRAQVYAAVSGGGSELLDSGVLSAVTPFPLAYLADISSTDPAQLVYIWTNKAVGGKLRPTGTSAARSIKFSLATSSAAVWSIGYCAAGNATAFSTSTIVGADFNAAAQYAGRSVETTGAGVTDSRLTSKTVCPLNIASMDQDDMGAWKRLFQQVADCRPFFLYPSTEPTTRESQLGLVRFASPRLDIAQRGTRLNASARYSLKADLTAWR